MYGAYHSCYIYGTWRSKEVVVSKASFSNRGYAQFFINTKAPGTSFVELFDIFLL